jgi:hypothetical protein
VADGDEMEGRDESAARIARLEAALAERDARLAGRETRGARDSRGAKLAEPSAMIAAQDAKLAALAEQFAKINELLGRNSRNSHLPPSRRAQLGASGGTAGRGRAESVGNTVEVPGGARLARLQAQSASSPPPPVVRSHPGRLHRLDGALPTSAQ